MHASISRRRALSCVPALAVGVPMALVVSSAIGEQPAGAPAGGSVEGKDRKARPAIDQAQVPNKGPRLESDLVFEFVYFAHRSIEVVKDMLKEQPALVNAAWDWGGGDWETALGAASHMGRRDIAELLLANKARLDLFAAAMLGKLDVVKAAIASFPDALQVRGPHGIPLVVHAQKGGEPAKEVLAFLNAEIEKSK